MDSQPFHNAADLLKLTVAIHVKRQKLQYYIADYAENKTSSK